MRQSTLARHLTWISRSDRPHRVVYCVASARTHETHQLTRSRSRHQHHRLTHRPDRTDALTTRAISHVGCGALHPSLRTWRTNPSLRTIRSQHSAHRTRCAHILSPPRHTTLSCSPPHARHAPTLVAPPATRNLRSSSQRPPQPARGVPYHYTIPRVVVDQRRRHRGSVSFAPSLISPCVVPPHRR